LQSGYTPHYSQSGTSERTGVPGVKQWHHEEEKEVNKIVMTILESLMAANLTGRFYTAGRQRDGPKTSSAIMKTIITI
jgi:hypothetical protein